jgi:hypothetical protein
MLEATCKTEMADNWQITAVGNPVKPKVNCHSCMVAIAEPMPMSAMARNQLGYGW